MISGTISKAMSYHVLFILFISLASDIFLSHGTIPVVQSVSVCSEMNTKCASRHNISSPKPLDDKL